MNQYNTLLVIKVHVILRIHWLIPNVLLFQDPSSYTTVLLRVLSQRFLLAKTVTETSDSLCLSWYQQFWGILVRYFAIYFFFSWHYTEVMGFGEEDNKGEIPFLSHHIRDTHYQYAHFLPSALSLWNFCQASFLSTDPWILLDLKPEQTLKCRSCPPYQLFLKIGWSHWVIFPVTPRWSVIPLICPALVH